VVPCKLATERLVKWLVQRERPGTTVSDAILRGVHPGGLSFVSGHAIITFAIAGLLGLVLPRRWAVVGFVLAGLNAVARVYLGAHNPLDVVGGAAVGLAIAAVLDLLLDVAGGRRGSRPGQAAPARDDRAA
jgi:membrane-associated phospholipid phosphatase